MVSNHYYSLTRVARYGDLLLVRLRNPWGEFEWKGDWSDNSHTWTQDVINYIQPEFDRDDGVFWMSFKDFHTYFMRVTVGKVGNWCEWRGRNIVYFDANTGGVP
mmetsp:Transcript_14906/g.2495  ORF Transcript_14906/g.2495 Transcript_14906/m.2495 type:complete len:104 (+) Transcript_14906:754-1065(+)